jgi:hypothetical protein
MPDAREDTVSSISSVQEKDFPFSICHFSFVIREMKNDRWKMENL